MEWIFGDDEGFKNFAATAEEMGRWILPYNLRQMNFNPSYWPIIQSENIIREAVHIFEII